MLLLDNITDTAILRLPGNEVFQHYYQATKDTSAISKYLNDASLKVIAGSIALLLGSNYVKPVQHNARLIYLLFIPAWISLGLSFYYSIEIYRINATLPMYKKIGAVKSLIFDDGGINEMYRNQSLAFDFGILFLSIWLISDLLWWVFIDKSKKQK